MPYQEQHHNREERRRKYEAHIIRRFLTHFREPWELVDQPPPPHPDALIGSAGSSIALELGRYREQGPYNERHTDDETFKQFLHDHWLYDESVSEYTLYIEYLLDERQRFCIPPKHMRTDVCNALKRLVADYGSELTEHECVIAFVDTDDTDEVLQKTPDRTYLITGSHDILRTYFSAVGIRYHPGIRLGMHSTSMNHKWIGLGRSEIRDLVASKHQKLVNYRQATTLPVWLLIHSDGWPYAAQIVDRTMLLNACEEARAAVMNTSGGRFDAIWWIDNVYSSGPDNLMLVYPNRFPTPFAPSVEPRGGQPRSL